MKESTKIKMIDNNRVKEVITSFNNNKEHKRISKEEEEIVYLICFSKRIK